jgi:hypothetical protein
VCSSPSVRYQVLHPQKQIKLFFVLIFKLL